MADRCEDGVGGIACTAFEIAAPEVTIALHVADHRLDRGTPSQLTFDDAEHATLLARDEDVVLPPADLRGVKSGVFDHIKLEVRLTNSTKIIGCAKALN